MTDKSIFSVWEGVFDNFAEAGGDLDAFDSKIWIDKQRTKILNNLEALENAALDVSKDYPLPIVVSMMLSQQNEVSVLDFGGGMGAQYLELLAKVPKAKEKLKYCIVDGVVTVKHTPPQMQDYENLRFCTSLDEVGYKVDIVHIGSALQYIEDWKSLLHTLEQKHSPKYFVFSDLLAGDVPTFVSHQIFYDKKIPHRFLNWTEFEEYLGAELQFSLQYKSKFIHNILNQETVYPNHGLPATHQIDRGLHVIFCRS